MILKLDSVTKTYKTSDTIITALNNFSYTFESKKIYGIVGLNGAGKTTLIKTICGLLIPDSGNIYFDNEPLYPNGLHNLKLIGAILEGSRNIFWNFTPIQNVKYFALLRGLNLNKAINKATSILEEFGLKDKLTTPVRNLSQGMKQKIAIAISILHNPNILLLDEPTLGLDPIAGNKMKDYIISFAKENEKIVIITSHQLSILEDICDKILFLKKGSLISCYNMKDLKSSTYESKYLIKANISNCNDLKTIEKYFNQLDIKGSIANLEFVPKVLGINNILEVLSEKKIEILDIEKISISLEDIFIKELS